MAGRIRIDAGEEEEYYSFVTPEAYVELSSWMEFRGSRGEKVDGTSWVMRDLWDVPRRWLFFFMHILSCGRIFS